MNIDINQNSQKKTGLSNLNESEKVSFNESPILMVLRNKSKQFNFDCGDTMGKIDVELKSRFGLNWHYKNTKSLEEFIESVRQFINTSDNDLTENDINLLTKQYQKYLQKTNKTL
jgi:hypothetical protein